MFSMLRTFLIRAAVVKCRAVADDKLCPPGTIYSGSSGLVTAGLTDAAKNLLAVVDMPFNDSLSGAKKIVVAYGRTNPVGAYASMPIGSLFVQVAADSSAAGLYLKTASGWKKILSGADASEHWVKTITTATITTAGAGSYSAANLLGGLIRRNPNGASRTDTIAAAADIVAAINAVTSSVSVGDSVRTIVSNTATADELITLAGGTGITLSPTDIYINPGQNKELLVVLTNVGSGTEAATVYDLDTLKEMLYKYAAVVTTAGAGTITATMVVNAGLILRNPNGADRTDTLPSAANLVAAIPACRVGSVCDVTYVNTATADQLITLAAGSGGTLAPASIIIGRGGVKRLTFRITNVGGGTEAYTCYDSDCLGYGPQTVGLFTKKTIATTGAGGAITISAAEMLGGYIRNDCNGASRNITTDTATNIVGAIPNCQIGSSFEFVYENISGGAYTATLVAGTGVTLATGMVATIERTYAARFLCVVTNVSSPAVTIYKVGYSVANSL